MSAAFGCSPTDRIRRPSGVLKSTTHERTTVRSISQIIRLSWPKTSPKKGMSLMNPRFTFGISSGSSGVPWVP